MKRVERFVFRHRMIAIFICLSFLVAGAVLLLGSLEQSAEPQTVQPIYKADPIKIAKPEVTPSLATGNSSGDANKFGTSPDQITPEGLLVFTNKERTSAGLDKLVLNQKLNKSAELKCDDMITRDYWNHNTPDNVEPWVFIDKTGAKYYKAGENLAYGYTNARSIIAGWMNSPTHRANLLEPAYTEVGYGICGSNDFVNQGPQTVVVQHLIRPR